MRAESKLWATKPRLFNHDYIQNNIEGDCLIAVGDEELIKIHYHTNTPWKVLEYCASLGDIHTIIVENMQRQSDGLQG